MDELLRKASFARISPDCDAFAHRCNRPIILDPTDPDAKNHCVIWQGATASRDVRPIQYRVHVADASKVTGDLRFTPKSMKKGSVSARVFVFKVGHGLLEDADKLEEIHKSRERLRLSSQCRNFRCVNPWHQVLLPPKGKKPQQRIDKPAGGGTHKPRRVSAVATGLSGVTRAEAIVYKSRQTLQEKGVLS